MKRIAIAVILIFLAATTLGAATTKKKKKTLKTKEQQAQSSAAIPALPLPKEAKQSNPGEGVTKPGPIPFGPPVERQLTRAASRRFDLRLLPQTRPDQRERVELEPPDHTPVTVQGNPEQPPAPSMTIAARIVAAAQRIKAPFEI